MQLRAVVIVAVVSVSAIAHGQVGYQGYPVSPRGMGMAGAMTALAEGASTLYYNPAGLAHGPHLQLQVSGSIYGLAGAEMRGALGGDGVDFRYNSVQVIPANLAFEVQGLRLGALELSRRWGLGVSILAPYSFKFAAVSEDASHGTIVLRDVEDKTYSVYAGVAYRIRDRLSFGAALVVVYRNFSERLSLARSIDGKYVSANSEQETSTVGLTAAFGVKYAPIEHLWLGLGLHLPLRHLFSVASTVRDRYAVFQQSTDSQYIGAVGAHSREVDARYIIPLRINVGLAWEVPHKWALAVGLYLWMPMEYNSLVDRATREVLGVNRSVLTVNATIGAEVWLRRGTIPLRFGAFTDRSSLDRPTADSALGDKVDLYGGTVSLGLSRKRSENEVAILGAAGPVTGLGFDVVGGTFEPREFTGTRWQFLVSYSTALHD